MKSEKLSGELSISPLAFQYLSFRMCHDTLTVFYSGLPLSLVDSSVWVDVLSTAMLQTGLVLSLVGGAVIPVVGAVALHHAVRPGSLVDFSGFYFLEGALAVEVSLFEETFVETAVWVLVLTVAVFFPIDDVSDVSTAVPIRLLSNAIWSVVRPVTHITISLDIIGKSALTMSNIVADLTLIDRTVAVNVSTIAIGCAISK